MALLEQLAFVFPKANDLEHEDMVRLGRQRADIWAVMLSGRWLTLAELEVATEHPQASISARLRDFRQKKYGGHRVDRRRRIAGRGTYEYRLTVRPT